MGVHTWEDPEIHWIWTVNQTSQNDSPNKMAEKWLAKGNPEEITHKSNSKCHKGATQHLSPWVHLCAYPHILYSLLKCFICFTTSNFVGILFYKSEWPGPLSLAPGLVASVWCSHHCDQASITSWELKPCSWDILLLVSLFLSREFPSAFVVKLVWWCWILLTFAYE